MNKGFTLIELMMSVAIMMLVSAVVIYNHQKFNDNLEITNLAYTVALSLRQAQVYGMSVQGLIEGDSEEERFGVAYGVHFDMDHPTSYIFFADTNHDGRYGGDEDNCSAGSSGGDLCLEKVTIGRGNQLGALCENSTAGTSCYSTNRAIDVTYKRPEPDGNFKSSLSNGTPNSVVISDVIVRIVSPGGRSKDISAYTTGQIAITNSPELSEGGDIEVPVSPPLGGGKK